MIQRNLIHNSIHLYQDQNQNQKSFNVPQTGKFVCPSSQTMEYYKIT